MADEMVSLSYPRDDYPPGQDREKWATLVWGVWKPNVISSEEEASMLYALWQRGAITLRVNMVALRAEAKKRGMVP